MGKVLKDIGVWMLLWCSGWGIYHLLLARDINYITAPLTSALYFSVASVAVLLLYKELLPAMHPFVRPLPWLAAVLSVAAGLLIYLLLPLFFAPPEGLMLLNPDMFFLDLNLRYLFAKPFEIVFQQVLILLLVALLVKRGVPLLATCLLCCLTFGAAHLYLVVRNGLLMGGYFAASAIVAGFVFPYLMLRVRNGLIYASSIHLLFYIFTGALCRLCPTALIS
jgi:hypothetical protein